jgi:tRNA(fMet)-specific endonuclease VapC
MQYLLDTNQIVFAIRGEGRVRRHVDAVGTPGIVISAVSIAELEYGSLRSADPALHRARWRRFVNVFDEVPFDSAAAIAHATLRDVLRQSPIGERDLMIAAIARARDLTVVTHNLAEFRRVPGLRIEDWL